MSGEDELWCPRRREVGYQYPGPDHWRDTPSLVGASAAGTPTCSYCGSLAPDRFLELVEAGWIVEPTDKDYKAYLARPLTEAEIADRKQTWLNGTVGRAMRRVEEAAGKTPEEIERVLDRKWESEGKELWTATATEAKFYFMHLSQEQQREFIELLNAKRVTFGIPGHFYTLPYFWRPAER